VLRLKGATANLSAKPIADLAFKLETSGRSGDLTGAEKTMAELKAELEKLEEYVSRSLAEEVTARG
jgi:HPt (histidine-containing phosphotransfer) domain-containing protein